MREIGTPACLRPELAGAQENQTWSETGDAADEIGVGGQDKEAAALHGAEDPRSFRLEHPGEYLEPMSRARPIEQFDDPRLTVESVNPQYHPEVGSGPYEVNCADCSRCFEATWRGQQQEAAGRAAVFQENGDIASRGESPEAMEAWAHQKFAPVEPAALRSSLETAGHGASAVVGAQWEGTDPGGHAYNVVNYNGEILVVDAQMGKVFDYSPKAIHPLLDRCDVVQQTAMGWDASGRKII